MANILSTKVLNEKYKHIASLKFYGHRADNHNMVLPPYKEQMWKEIEYHKTLCIISNCMILLTKDKEEIPKVYFNGDKPILKENGIEKLLSDVVNDIFGDNSRIREFKLDQFNHLRIGSDY